MIDVRTALTSLADLIGEADAAVEDTARAIEAVLFVSGEPVPLDRLADAVQVAPHLAEAAVHHLAAACERRGLQVQAVAGGYQLVTHPAYAEVVRRFLGAAAREPLSQAALEVLAIVAYRQPVTRAEVEAVRGVRCEHLLERLEERQLVRVVGRKPTVGRPLLYGTTDAFLRYFGLRSLADLPPRPDLVPVAARDGQASPDARDAAAAPARSAEAPPHRDGQTPPG